MARFFPVLFAGAFLALGAASCSAPSDESPGVVQQALTRCFSDEDCAYTSSITVGEHCGLDGACHTFAEDPTCGLWEGTYPNCVYYPGDCRISHCASPTTCGANGFCELPGAGGECSPYAYANPCPSECVDDFDCDLSHTCEYTPFGNVCG